jgi:serine beta-lactamase-like protein LACTB
MLKRLLFTALIILPVSLFAQDTTTKISQADSIVQAFYVNGQIPGMSVSVFMGDEVVWSKGYGFADLESQQPVDPALTKFRIGSVSKTVTAAALGRLIEEGKIDPDATVQTYVPDFPEKEWPITVRQVAGHTAGIRHYRGDEFMSNKLYATVDEGLAIFEDDPLLFEPGTQYSYSSYGWNLISAVIEGAAGEDFLPYMQREVFDALGMKNTVPEWSNRDIENLTSFYVPGPLGIMPAPFVDNSYKWAGGGFVGTTEDLIRFGEAFLDYKYIDEETQQELMFPLELTNGESTNYGMGWRLLEHNGTYWVGHSGGSVGGSTMFILNKEHRIVIAYTINRSNVGFDALHFKLADVFLGE